MLYNPDGTSYQAPYEDDVLSFEFEGISIRNPMLSECGRGPVDPKYYGFEEYHTGGGCMAYRLELPGGDYFLLTDGDGCGLPHCVEDAETAILGRYNSEGDTIALITVGDIPFESDVDDE